jgi:hypothetical protein
MTLQVTLDAIKKIEALCQELKTKIDRDVTEPLNKFGIIAGNGPKVTEFSSFKKRLTSFSIYPNLQMNDDHLSRAGFYFTGSEIKCFYCGAEIQKSTNSPWNHHYPECAYALLYLGPNGIPSPLTNIAGQENTCCICTKKCQDYMILPCTHAGYCYYCVTSIEKCFSCGTGINGYLELKSKNFYSSLNKL